MKFKPGDIVHYLPVSQGIDRKEIGVIIKTLNEVSYTNKQLYLVWFGGAQASGVFAEYCESWLISAEEARTTEEHNEA